MTLQAKLLTSTIQQHVYDSYNLLYSQRSHLELAHSRRGKRVKAWLIYLGLKAAKISPPELNSEVSFASVDFQIT